DFERAIPALQRALEIEPGRIYYSNLGVIYYYLGRFDESVATHRKAIAITPEDGALWINLGDALQFSAESDQARSAFEKAAELAEAKLDVNPRESGIMLDLAWARAMLGDTDLSAELISESIRLAPSDPYGYYYLALLETKRGRNEAALDALEIAVEKGYPTVMLESEPYLEDLKDNDSFLALINSDREQVSDQQ
ncbi:MAG: tetratricopeptide repeat protein, partial [Gammaproteobacteria bacterium]